MKIQLKLSDNDKNIIIPFGGVGNLLGYDDDVISLVTNKTDESINISDDLEVKRFKSAFTGSTYSMSFNFWSGSSYITELAPYDFTGLTTSSDEARNSFYVIQIYDTFDEAVQTKLHTGYFNGYDFNARSITGLTSVYNVNNDLTEFLNIYLTNTVIEENPSVLYAKFFFYSAKSGKFYPFSVISASTKQEDLYLKLLFDLTGYTYTYVDYPTFNFSVYEITNPDYSTSINDSVISQPVQRTTYPTGNTFTVDGVYIDQ